MHPRLQIEDVDVTGGVSQDDKVAARSQHQTRRLQSRKFQCAFEAIVKQLVSAHRPLIDVPRCRELYAAEGGSERWGGERGREKELRTNLQTGV